MHQIHSQCLIPMSESWGLAFGRRSAEISRYDVFTTIIEARRLVFPEMPSWVELVMKHELLQFGPPPSSNLVKIPSMVMTRK